MNRYLPDTLEQKCRKNGYTLPSRITIQQAVEWISAVYGLKITGVYYYNSQNGEERYGTEIQKLNGVARLILDGRHKDGIAAYIEGIEYCLDNKKKA